MPKRKSAALLNSDSDDSRSSDSGSDDIDKDMLNLAKKNKGVSGSTVGDRKPKLEAFSSSSSSSSDSESDADSQTDKKIKRKPGKRARRSASGTTESSMSQDDRDSDNGNAPPASEAPSSSFVAPLPVISAVPSVVSSTMPDVETNKTASDLEEGEVSDEDISDNDSEAEEFNDGYDDNLMGDDDDQRQLSAMTEKEREQEIYKRIEQRELLRGRFEMEKKLRMKKKLEAKLAKRGLKRTDLPVEEPIPDEFQIDAKVRSQERKKTVEAKTDKKSQAMDQLKASRDAKIQRAQEKEKMRMEKEKRREEKNLDDDELDLRKDDDASSSVGDKKIKKLNTSDVYSDDSGSDDQNEVVKKEKKRSISDSDSRSSSDSEDEERNRKPQFVEKVEDLNKIRLSRFKMERWLYLPFFPRVLKGCFVRLGIQGPRGTKSTYDICEIMDIEDTSKVYQLGNTRTNKGIRVRYGNSNKIFRFEYVSNQDFTQDEFNKWKDGYENLQIVRPTLDQIEKKVKEIKECLDYQLKEEDIEPIITEKAKFKRAPVNFAAKKTQLFKEREIAVMNGDDDRTAEIATEIQDLDERAKELDKMRTASISNIGYINERNRKKNVEEAEKAILEELKSNKGKKVEDPFTRRNTKPRIVSKPISGLVLGLENLPGFGTIKLEDGSDADKKVDSTLISMDMVDGSDASLNKFQLDDSDDKKDEQLAIGDLFSAHDFDIKLDLDAKLPPNLPIVARPSMTPIKDTAPRRSLNLEEYKRKKGLI